MNSGKHEKFTVKPEQKNMPKQEENHNCQAKAGRERITEIGLQEKLIEIDWVSERKSSVERVHSEVPSEEQKLAWPTLVTPTQAFKPKRNNSVPSSAPIMLVAVFGRDDEGVQSTVRQIEQQQQQTRNFIPLFLTDSSLHSVFRHAGFSFEYFPPAQYCDDTQRDLFQQKFMKIWGRWRAETLVDLSAPGFLKNRLDDFELLTHPMEEPENKFQPRRRPTGDRSQASTDVAALRAEYLTKGLDQKEDTFVLYRILGNDLPPRHKEGQTLENLRFLLDHEPPLKNCEKRWVVNRMVNPVQEQSILDLLEQYDQPYLRIPFELDEYRKRDWDLESFPDLDFFLNGRFSDMNEYGQQRAESYARRHKNRYAINNNGARNTALRDGLGRAKWVLPWDGNCFLTKEAWAEVVEGVTSAPYMKYFLVPMARALDNAHLLQEGYRPEATEEPQILFRCDAGEEFDENYHYGRRPKVELFLRLGLAGGWNSWYDDCWDPKRPARVEDAGSCGRTGWVSRLFSGQEQLEVVNSKSLRSRGVARSDAVNSLLDQLDQDAADIVYDPKNLTAYEESKVMALSTAPSGSPKAKIFGRLIQEADLALQRGPFSVVDKLSAPPSDDKHDYYNPAPYWWPNPNTANGMPLVYKDGLRIPGTKLYDAESDNFDRTRLQRLFDDTTVLALAWKTTGNLDYAEHATRNIRHWFISEDSKMNPHLMFAQSKTANPSGADGKSGLIEMKDLYFLLDAVRLLEQSKTFGVEDQTGLREWLTSYLDWLLTSEKGQAERKSHNNHGTCFDLQTAAIAAYLGNRELLQSTFRTSRERLLTQFSNSGEQPYEMKRTQTAHYCCFNLQCWVNLATLAARCGHNLWQFEGQEGQGLAIAFNWLLSYLAKETWPFEQIEQFDRDRFLPLFFVAKDLCNGGKNGFGAKPEQAKPLFFPHDGIMPFWMLGQTPLRASASKSTRALAKTVSNVEAPVIDSIVPTGNSHNQEIDLPLLDKKMWGGFSKSAQAELEMIKCDPETPKKKVNRASRQLARWHFLAGDFGRVLLNVESMGSLDSVKDCERRLMEAYCRHQVGQLDEAETLLQQSLLRFPDNANLCLAMANLHGGLGPVQNAEDGKNGLYWLNKIYREAGLIPLELQEETNDNSSISVNFLPQKQKTPEEKGRQLVTVIVTVGGDYPYQAIALQSLLQQVWQDLEIIVVDMTGQDNTASDLRTAACADTRVKIVSAPDLKWEYQARNLGLQHASGTYVTTHCANEIVHPEKIAEQMSELETQSCEAVMSCKASLTQEMQFVAGWYPDFSLQSAQTESLLLPTETLRQMGGWDAVEQNPDAYLLWRVKKLFGSDAVGIARNQVPLSFVMHTCASLQPTHQNFPYGRKRDEHKRQLRMIQSHLADAETEQLPDSQPAMAFPALAELALRKSKYDVVYVGDFAEGAFGLSVLIRHLVQAQQQGQHVGVFNWPDYRSQWDADLGAELTELIDDSVVTLISGSESVTAQKLILCNPYIVEHAIDGFPNFSAKSIDVLCGAELATAEICDGFRRTMPTSAEIEEALQAPCNWVAI